jgi:uncharacterized protein (TIGR00251 family)
MEASLMPERIDVRVVPGASRDQVDGEMGDGRLKIRLRAKAVEGAANEALVEFVARRLKLARWAVSIAYGAHSRQKTLQLEGVDAAAARAQLLKDEDAQ